MRREKGFRIEGERDKERVTGEGGEGRREGEEALRVNKMIREGERESMLILKELKS